MSKYEFEYLRPFNKIIVIGPGRSGTTIATKIIAHELKYKFIDESWFEGTLFEKFLGLLNMDRKMVIQAPCLTHKMHWIGSEASLAFVLMKRDINDILKSQKHTLTFKTKAPNKGTFTACTPEWKKFRLTQYNLPEDTDEEMPNIVYNYWYDHQAHAIKNSFELEYESLKDHSLWIEKEDRRKLFTTIKQINPDPNYIHKIGVMVNY